MPLIWPDMRDAEVWRRCIPSSFLTPTRARYWRLRFNQDCAVTSRAHPTTPTVRRSSVLVSVVQHLSRRCNRGIKFPSKAAIFTRRLPLTSPCYVTCSNTTSNRTPRSLLPSGLVVLSFLYLPWLLAFEEKASLLTEQNVRDRYRPTKGC